MFDEYSLRLLAEIGVDVYVPRVASARALDAPAASTTNVSVIAAEVSVDRQTIVAIVGTPSPRIKLLGQVGQALRFARVHSAVTDASDLDAIASMRGLVVFGDALARALGNGLPTQRQVEIEWVIASEPDTLARSAAAKRALWGEIKRLSRALAVPAISDASAR